MRVRTHAMHAHPRWVPALLDIGERAPRMVAVSRAVTLAIGLVGAILAFVVNTLYSLAHVLARLSGITADRSHFFIGTGLSIVAAIGAALVIASPEGGAVLMVLATIGLFFILGWWAIIPAVFLLSAAGLALFYRLSARGREVRRPPTGASQT